ncbi:MAG: hypothetical protein ACREJM_03810, partial [Candidatus Saccharimonadales bacterium]
MPTTYDKPGSDYDQDSDGGYDGPAAGKSSDPRSEYDPQTSPKFDDSDPRDEIDEAERNPEAGDGDATSGAASAGSLRGSEESAAARAAGRRSRSGAGGGLYNAEGESQGRL